MQFLNPLVLFGLVAASIPVILHLLNLRKLKTVEFSTLRFLKELQKTKIRRLKLRQIILLILRTLLIIFLVLAFARPTIESSLPVIGSKAKTSAVILIDNSFSMDVSDELGNRLNQAKFAVKSIVEGMNEGDEASIIYLTTKESDNNSLSRNIDLLKQDLNKIIFSYSAANLATGLRLASKLLDKSVNLNREVYIITDAQRNILNIENKDSVKMFDKTSVVYFIPIGAKSKSEIVNLSFDSINVINRIFQKGKPVEVEAIVRNNSNKDITGAVASMYFNNERVTQRTFDVPANQLRTLSMAAEPRQSGAVKAFLELDEDALNADNKRFFGFNIPDKPNVVVVGNQNDISFISKVFNAASRQEPVANVIYINPAEIAGTELSNYELVILAAGPYLKSDFNRIEQYVRNGGSCFFFADDLSPADIFNYGTSLLGFGNIKQLSYSEASPSKFSAVDKTHPLFEGVFKGTTNSKAIAESPKIYKAFSNTGGTPVIEIPGGYFLSESRIGDGRVLYCSVKPSTQWSNFPLTGLFPTMIYRSTFYLSGREGIGISSVVGNSVMLSLPKLFSTSGNYKIIDPNVNEFYQQAAVLPNGTVLSLGNLNILGNYIVYSQQGKAVSIISVNPLPSESYLKPVSNDEIEKNIESQVSKNTHIRFIDDSRNIAQSVQRARTGTELWQLFVILAILCAIAEMIVARNSKKELIES
ncbi:MAG: BatA domain-containing protein [Ignavibacteriae bacterium]|nr:BatA domain-containing protein [Ignavibacteriota bacterium]